MKGIGTSTGASGNLIGSIGSEANISSKGITTITGSMGLGAGLSIVEEHGYVTATGIVPLISIGSAKANNQAADIQKIIRSHPAMQ